MTLAQCKSTISSLIADPQNKVVALSGNWGTGKSHLWREVRNESSDQRIKESLHLSLFGVGSIRDLKLKLLRGLLPEGTSNGGLAAWLYKTAPGLSSVLKGFHPSFAALDDLAFLALPELLKERFIAIDDIERMQAGLSIEELLGFIDDGVQNLNCRFLLILNDDKIATEPAKALWQQFHEKVIDHEVRLDTSSTEAFSIARGPRCDEWLAQVQEAVEVCQISNIRVIRKIIRLVHRLLDGRGQLPASVLQRVIAPTTLLGAIHFQAIDDGPSIEDVLENKLDSRLSEDGPIKWRDRVWKERIARLNLGTSGGFEREAYKYLKSGMIDDSSVQELIDRFAKNHRQLTVQAQVQSFIRSCEWDIHTSDQDRLATARTFLPDVGVLNVLDASMLIAQVEDLPEGKALADELVEDWLLWLRGEQDPSKLSGLVSDSLWDERHAIHPRFREEAREIRSRIQSTGTLLNIILKMNEKKVLDADETSLLASVTSQEFEKAFFSASENELRILLNRGLALVVQRENAKEPYAHAANCFLDACRTTVSSNQNPRLTKLIRALFRSAQEPKLLMGDPPNTS
ncbi:hypothetical protein [Hydrogenophaga sp.]|uniref:hypothetical protein n=1 Tax=Hydrogenophaga sp. TaxID=1904254 RepID=UPI003F71632E